MCFSSLTMSKWLAREKLLFREVGGSRIVMKVLLLSVRVLAESHFGFAMAAPKWARMQDRESYQLAHKFSYMRQECKNH